MRPPHVYLLGIEPVAVAVSTATNPWHFLFWAEPGVYSADGVWTFASGIGFSLAIVDKLASAHGWSVDITGSILSD